MPSILKLLIVLLFAAGLVACYSSESEDAVLKKRVPPAVDRSRPAIDQPETLIELVRSTLEQVQDASIAENLEYCGYIVVAPNGVLKIVGPERGSAFGCRTPLVYKPDVILASFHTHGAFDARAFTEMPSSIDFEAVATERVDAFVGTPGGRFWHIDFETATARLLCGPRSCLPRQKPTRIESEEAVPSTLTLPQVLEIERQIPKAQKR